MPNASIKLTIGIVLKIREKMASISSTALLSELPELKVKIKIKALNIMPSNLYINSICLTILLTIFH
jgi:hypothetical protein